MSVGVLWRTLTLLIALIQPNKTKCYEKDGKSFNSCLRKKKYRISAWQIHI